MDESYVGVNAKGNTTSFVGPDATELFRVMTLRGALDLYAKCKIVPSRRVTISRMLTMASDVTHKPYKRGDAVTASADLSAWIDAMKSSMPVVRDE
jgi:hypothetical protein